jgi:hypothetical protein
MANLPKPEKWEQWVVGAVVIIAAITAVVHAAFKSFPDWAVTSVLFLAAFTIMIQNGQISSSIEEFTTKFRKSDAESIARLSDILKQLSSNASATNAIKRELENLTSVHIHANYADFYKDLRASTEHAHDMVRASYMRRFPPAKLGGDAEEFFESSLNWARQDAHHLRRIVCRPDEDALLAWVRAQDQKSQEPGSHYLVRVVDWTVRDVDALSVAIVDEDIVFFAFSGSEDSMRGFSMRNRAVARYFIEYHNQLWSSSEPLERFLAKQGTPKG